MENVCLYIRYHVSLSIRRFWVKGERWKRKRETAESKISSPLAPWEGLMLRLISLSKLNYRIYSLNRPGRLLNFWTLRVGAYSRWALIRGWALIKFSPFSASEVCLFCNKTINANNKTRRSNKARFL